MAKPVTSLKPPIMADEDDEAEISSLPPISAVRSAKDQGPSGVVDLGDAPRAIFLIGGGKVGKTVLGRYLAEVFVQRGGELVIAAADPGPRSIKNFIRGVIEPETNDPALTTRWLQQLVSYPASSKKSFMVDLGGGDTSLHRLLTMMPDLVKRLEDQGVAPVAIYPIGTRMDDLANLKTYEELGFQPKARAVVSNEGMQLDPTMTREEAFAALHRSKIFKAAISNGATHVWMPRMEPSAMTKLETKRLPFLDARDGIMPTDRKVAPLDMWDQSAVAVWLDQMHTALTPILGWLPR